ncbi:hypothetical protein CR513_00508, partial [Mucuna pruriens]
MCDASNSALGVVLGQRVGKQPHFSLKKPYAKPRLVLWMLFLQEFNLEIKEKKGVENDVADHLSQLKREVDPQPIRDESPDDNSQVHLGSRDPVCPPLLSFSIWRKPYGLS